MNPRLMKSAITVAAVLCVSVCLERVALGATSLLVSQGIAFAALGHSCGGIQEQALATGFDAGSGYPTGNVYVQTRCGGSGRGGGYHTTTYSAWLGVTWDFTGAVVSFEVLAGGPAAIDPTFSAFDAFGNEVYNQLNGGNVPPANCTVGNTSGCAYRAFLALAPGFAPPPRLTGISVNTGPATGGTSVTINGTGFTGATTVSFGTAPATSFTVTGDTSIAAMSPAAAAGTVDVTVTTAGGTSPPSEIDQFTFVAAPTVSGLSPDNGPIDGGTLVTISGTNFIDVVSVSFGETSAGFTVNADASITATVPAAEATDTVHVVVTTIGGTSTRSAADKFTYTPSVPTSYCGDAIVDPGEQCDDGVANGMPGDCCSVTCTFAPLGTACTDDGSLCTADVCGDMGTCTHPSTPALTCTPPDVSQGAVLAVRALTFGRNAALFQWSKGPVVTLSDFGDPAAGDLVQLCVYDQTGPDTYSLALTASPSVSGGGTWMARPLGWRFRSKTGAPDGVVDTRLTTTGQPLSAVVRLRLRNSPALGPLPLQQNPSVVAQVKSSSGACWGATFSTHIVNTATTFKAKSD